MYRIKIVLHSVLKIGDTTEISTEIGTRGRRCEIIIVDTLLRDERE